MIIYMLSAVACMMCVWYYIQLQTLGDQPDAVDKAIVWSILILGFIPVINLLVAAYCVSLYTLVFVLIKLKIIE